MLKNPYSLIGQDPGERVAAVVEVYADIGVVSGEDKAAAVKVVEHLIEGGPGVRVVHLGALAARVVGRFGGLAGAWAILQLETNPLIERD